MNSTRQRINIKKYQKTEILCHRRDPGAWTVKMSLIQKKFANDEFGKIFVTLIKCSRTMNLEKIFVTLIKCSRTMNSEKIFATLIKSSLTFFKVTNFCGSRTFFSIPTNNICGSRTYFQIYCLWTFLKSRIFFPYSRTFFWINEHFYYSRTRGIFDAKDFQIFLFIFFIFRTVHHASWPFRGG